MGLLIFYATISIFFSFLCSILEAVLLSITPTFINVKKQEGKAYAVELEELKHRLNTVGGNRHGLSADDQTILVVLDLAELGGALGEHAHAHPGQAGLVLGIVVVARSGRVDVGSRLEPVNVREER